MNTGPSQPPSASKQVLIAALVFTVAAYSTFLGMWKIVIPLPLLLMVVAVQFAMLLLGGTRLLTGLGVAFLAAILSVAALFAAVLLLFPHSLLHRSAASVAGAATLLFILTSFITASREPVPSMDASLSTDIDELFGESGIPVGTAGQGPAEGPTEAGPGEGDAQGGRRELDQHQPSLDLGIEPVLEYEFDDLPDDKLVRSLAGDGDDMDTGLSFGEPPTLPTEGEGAKAEKPSDVPGEYGMNDPGEIEARDRPEEPPDTIPEEWVEAAARELAWDGVGETQDQTQEEETTGGSEEDLFPTGEFGETLEPPASQPEEPSEIQVQPLMEAGTGARTQAQEEPGRGTGPESEPEPESGGMTGPETVPVYKTSLTYPKEYRMRTHYRVLDSRSGELYGVYYGDEGYASLDPVTLGALLGEKIGSGDIRIVKLDWSNFDEIEVHVEKAPPEGTPDAGEVYPGRPSEAGFPWEVPDEGEAEAPQRPPAKAETGRQRYLIYDRRTFQRMGEYVPEGNQPRIDRLTLYKLFPEYDFKTFEIDSIRWHGSEIRILIKGERKTGKGAKEKRGRGEEVKR